MWLTWLEHHTVNRKVTGSVPGQGTCLGCRFYPRSRHVLEATINVSVPLSLPAFSSLSPSPPLSLKSISMSSVEDKKNRPAPFPKSTPEERSAQKYRAHAGALGEWPASCRHPWSVYPWTGLASPQWGPGIIRWPLTASQATKPRSPSTTVLVNSWKPPYLTPPCRSSISNFTLFQVSEQRLQEKLSTSLLCFQCTLGTKEWGRRPRSLPSCSF